MLATETRKRDAVKTRRAVLDAAGRAVRTHGARVSLDTVAREAGLSKGGLMHHFRSRDELFIALAEDLLEQFTAAVHAKLDPGDFERGRFVRAYVRATLDDLASQEPVSEQVALLAALSTTPGVLELVQQDTRNWEAAFAADGLHPDRVLLITRAADGASMAALYEGRHDAEKTDRTRDMLIALTRDPGPVISPE